MSGNLCFLIIERDPFIARDLSLGLADAAPGCVAVICRDWTAFVQECGVIPDHAVPRFVITTLPIPELSEVARLELLRRHRITPVLRGADEDLDRDWVDRGWLSLPAPFATEDLDRLVRQLAA